MIRDDCALLKRVAEIICHDKGHAGLLDSDWMLAQGILDAVAAHGLSVRDYFAAAALQAMGPSAANMAAGDPRVDYSYVANCAYRLADAMLAERAK